MKTSYFYLTFLLLGPAAFSLLKYRLFRKRINNLIKIITGKHQINTVVEKDYWSGKAVLSATVGGSPCEFVIEPVAAFERDLYSYKANSRVYAPIDLFLTRTLDLTVRVAANFPCRIVISPLTQADKLLEWAKLSSAVQIEDRRFQESLSVVGTDDAFIKSYLEDEGHRDGIVNLFSYPIDLLFLNEQYVGVVFEDQKTDIKTIKGEMIESIVPVLHQLAKDVRAGKSTQQLQKTGKKKIDVMFRVLALIFVLMVTAFLLPMNYPYKIALASLPIIVIILLKYLSTPKKRK